MYHSHTFNKKKRKFKEKKHDGPNRKARLVIRNLPFKTTEDDIAEHFSKFGQIDEITLLRRPDGKLVGCGFIQFHAVQMAAKAMYNTTGKPFMGRTIICDWAVPKNKFVEQMQGNNSKDLENKNDDEIVTVKEEVQIEDETNVTNMDVKEEDDDIVDVKDEVDSNSDNENVEIKKESDESEVGSVSSDIKDDMDDQSDIGIENENGNYNEDVVEEDDEPKKKRPRIESNDVSEGRTVFIKNVPFTATDEDLKECMSQFGPLLYAVICVDPLTEHSKGSAFVKFMNKEDADKCLESGTELTLLGNILVCHAALDRKTIQDRKNQKNVKVKDSRNLYLVKEGVITAGTKSAEGVSAADMAKRLELEQWKSQKLRNLNMFVSRIRLIIHNLPASWDDRKLKLLVTKHADSKAEIREVRVMRDLKYLDSKGVGKSKEYGFVSFTNHEDAISVLRSLNNNPNVFNPNRRPIVAFSIENKVAINNKQRRLQKSKLRNPHCKEYDSTVSKKKKNNENIQKSVEKSNVKQDKPFVGIISKPGNKRIGKKHNLKMQAKIHFQTLKDEKKKAKKKRQLEVKKSVHIRQPRQKRGKGKEEKDTFSKIENKYTKAVPQKSLKKKKWYN